MDVIRKPIETKLRTGAQITSVPRFAKSPIIVNASTHATPCNVTTAPTIHRDNGAAART